MEDIEINLRGKDDLRKMIKTVIDKSFFKTVDGKKFVISEFVTQVTFDFKGSPFIGINTLAYLALVIRRLAENGVNIFIKWPGNFQGKPSAMHKYLYNTGFSKLFSKEASSCTWLKNISSIGPNYNDLYDEESASATHYIKLLWFNESFFDYDKKMNIWYVHPKLKTISRDLIEDVLVHQGFIDSSITDVFFNVIFKEIGWNIVLHSPDVPGKGYGIFGAQIIEKKLFFTFGDLGKSIPFTLGDYYYQKNLNWEQKLNVSSKAAIVRFALEKDSSSRPAFSSLDVKKAFRGLALVANSLNEGSSIEIVSNGGSTLIYGRQLRSKAKVENYLEKYDFPGTFILGALSQSSNLISYDSYKYKKPIKEEVPIIRCYNMDGSPIERKGFKKKLTELKKNTNFKSAHLDIGFTDYNIHSLEYIIIDFIDSIGEDCEFLFVWNISSDWSLFQFSFGWIFKNYRSIKFVCFIKNFNDSYLLKFDDNDKFVKNHRTHFEVSGMIKYPINEDKIIDIYTTKININYYIEMLTQLNSHYLNEGFKEGNKSNGFYIGDIHLLSGNSIGWFFSLTKNITQNSSTNLSRWVKSCFAGFIKLIDEVSETKAQVIILGFSAPIRPVLLELSKIMPKNIELYSILTYDVPTKEEVSFILKDYTHVILMTDVVSTGSLISEVTELIRNENKKLIGIITLVDALNIKKSFKWTEQVDHSKVQLLSFGEIKIPALRSDDLFNTRYWIDPISLIPGEKDILSEDIDHRIEKSLSVLSRNKIAKITHIVDGTRHSAVYFDLKELLKSNYSGVIEKLVFDEIKTRLEVRQWAKNFKPSAVVYPIGTSRIEQISNPTLSAKETDPKSTTNYYVKLIKNHWPNLEDIPVLRVFEPGGLSRCAKMADVKNTTQIREDFIIVDDGIWSGRTLKSLLELAKSLNAKRIIFIPLLARFTKSELDYWESIESLDFNNEKIEVCFIFPMFIPIPFYTNNQCPYELTIKRLETWKEKNIMLAPLIDRVVESLKGKDRSENIIADERYIKYWLKVRTYSELAAENQTALRVLVDFMKEAKSQNALLALVNVYLHEWHIIGRARLRQSISNEMISKCHEIIKNHQNNTELLISTLSLLRSVFPTLFLEELSKMKFQEIKDINLVERITIHLVTLPESLKKSPTFQKVLQDFIKSILQLSIGLDSNSELLTKRYTQVLIILKKIIRKFNITNSSLNIKEAVNELFDLLLNHYTLRHDTWSFIEQLTGNIYELDIGTFKQFYEKWDKICNSIMTEKIFPLLEKTKNIIILTSTPQDSIPTADVEYLIDGDDDEGGITIKHDLEMVQLAIEFLISRPDSTLWLDGLHESAKRIQESIAGENSFLVRTLGSLKEIKLSDFLEHFQRDLRLRFPIHKTNNLIITITNNSDDSILDDYIFAPKHLLESCKLNIIDNLYKYAFKEICDVNSERLVDIVINFTRTNSNDKLISIIVNNNGEKISQDIEQSDAALRIRNDLIQFGGEFPKPKPLNEKIWEVSQSINVLLW